MNSTRQDKGNRIYPKDYYLQYLRMGIWENNSKYLGYCNFIFDLIDKYNLSTPDILVSFMLDPDLIECEYSEVFEPKEYKTFSIILFAAGILVGIIITILSGPYMLVAGGIGVLLTYLYSFLKYRALGDLDIFLIFGVLTVLGTTYALTGSYVPQALILSLPIGVITVSVLHANNTYDSVTDKEAGIKTFAMLLGLPKSATLYRCYMFIPFLCVAAYIAFGLMHPLAALCFVAAIPAWKNQKQAGRRS